MSRQTDNIGKKHPKNFVEQGLVAEFFKLVRQNFYSHLASAWVLPALLYINILKNLKRENIC